jgi:hypothetical protein
MRWYNILASAKSILVIGLAYSPTPLYNDSLTAPNSAPMNAPINRAVGSLTGIYDRAFFFCHLYRIFYASFRPSAD